MPFYPAANPAESCCGLAVFEKWGIHFTQVTPISCGLGSRDFGVPIGDDRAVGCRLDGDRLLHKPVEELAAAA